MNLPARPAPPLPRGIVIFPGTSFTRTFWLLREAIPYTMPAAH